MPCCGFLDRPPSNAVGEQSVARVHRCGQHEIVEAITFFTKDSFNDRQNQKNLRKTFPGTMSQLNRILFGRDIAVNTIVEDEINVDLGQWVQFGEEMMRVNDPTPLSRWSLRAKYSSASSKQKRMRYQGRHLKDRLGVLLATEVTWCIFGGRFCSVQCEGHCSVRRLPQMWQGTFDGGQGCCPV